MQDNKRQDNAIQYKHIPTQYSPMHSMTNKENIRLDKSTTARQHKKDKYNAIQQTRIQDNTT